MGAIDFAVISAIARRELSSYLGKPAGYVFLTLFIAATGAGAFLQEGFFARNLADLALLNKVMPAILMLFVPAVTMNVWAEERRRGTDELLMTMPVRDVEVVLGKYLGALGVFTVGLAFSLAHVAVLGWLGEPDIGLMFSTYLGYWLVGSAFVSLGLLASLFSANATVAFILGAIGCAALVFTGAEPWASGLVGCVLMASVLTLVWVTIQGNAEGAGYVAVIGGVIALIIWLSGTWPGFEDAFAMLGVDSHSYGFGEGVVRLGDVVYFLGISSVVLYLCTFMLGRRHW
ncbi:ABC-2 transporter permease [Pseudenhygromyxa sp. WMMC2535]|uniref:ABC transporter permease n=1 Tax=Pseudenhygromyxa sp. WMMC2535 TaxID=2712867 RepID=UPI001554FE5E|nr:ABC-2 transporter permease [Pseudenhygromyxa sp. WMMC2535]NVB42111.1 ABC-2 transporter permease [Pseudenhygromyxa sp. WMMC2535]